MAALQIYVLKIVFYALSQCCFLQKKSVFPSWQEYQLFFIHYCHYPIRDCNHSIQVKWISLKTAYHYKNIK